MLPIKAFRDAKSRLRDVGPTRSAFAKAFALDTASVAIDTVGPHRVVAVVGDRETYEIVRPLGCVTIIEKHLGRSGDPLNAAVAQGCTWLAERFAHEPCAVVPVDLAALTAEVLSEVLDDAEAYERAFCADLSGRGSTIVTAARPALLTTAYGTSSADLHHAMGIHRLIDPDVRARSDIDTLADLSRTRVLGLGPRTSAVVRDTGLC